MCDDLTLKHPFTCLVNGPSGSGKSSFYIRFLHNHKTLCTVHTFDGGVIRFYSKRSAVPSRQLAGTKNFRFNEGVPQDFDNGDERARLTILEDLL